MLIIASDSSEFLGKWDKVVGQPDATVHVASIDSLKELLGIHAAHLVVLDMTLEGGKDPDMLRSIAEAKRSARLILSGIKFSPNAELAGLAVGAVACCPASLSVDECRKIMGVVMQGGVWLSSAGIPALVDKLRDFSARAASVRGAGTPEAPGGPGTGEAALDGLTRREREVAMLVGSGASNKDIARRLNISDRTVKAHLTAIFDKLKVQDRLQLALLVSGGAPG